MDDIHLHGLARLINEGMNGEAHFGGTVYVHIRGEDDGDGPTSQELYQANGQFVLTQSRNAARGGYNLAQRDSSGNLINNFSFKSRPGEKAQAHYEKRSTPAMTLGIDLHPQATLQINIATGKRILY